MSVMYFCWKVGKEGECYICLERKELHVGELPPNACDYGKQNWYKICVPCHTRLGNLGVKVVKDENGLAEFTGFGDDGMIYSGGFGLPPPEYYEACWMDDDGFDEAGNYVAGGFFM